MTAKQLILIIEDEPDIAELLQYNLEREGFLVETSRDGESGFKRAVSGQPSVIVLDLMLPGIQGLEVCRLLKSQEETGKIPVLMLTAKGEESDVVLGLEIGADDYMTKPFSPRELVARIRAVLRRSSPLVHQETKPERIIVGKVTIDLGRHEVLADGRPVSLTPTEFRLLETLTAHPGRVFTRDQLLDRITEGKSIVIDRNVDVHIRSVRQKLGEQAHLIVTVRGIGYKCEDPSNQTVD